MKNNLSVLIILFVVIFSSCSLGTSNGLKQKGSIYGIVVESSSTEPLAGFGVELYRVGYDHNSLLLKTVTFDDGHFEFTDLDPDEYLIKVVATGYDESSTEYYVTVESGRQARVDMMLTTTYLFGSVVDSQTGKPIAGVIVTLKSMISSDIRYLSSCRWFWGQTYTTLTNFDGMYSINIKQTDLSKYAFDDEDVPAEMYLIRMEADGYNIHRSYVVDKFYGDESNDLDQIGWRCYTLAIKHGPNQYNAVLYKE